MPMTEHHLNSLRHHNRDRGSQDQTNDTTHPTFANPRSGDGSHFASAESSQLENSSTTTGDASQSGFFSGILDSSHSSPVKSQHHGHMLNPSLHGLEPQVEPSTESTPNTSGIKLSTSQHESTHPSILSQPVSHQDINRKNIAGDNSHSLPTGTSQPVQPHSPPSAQSMPNSQSPKPVSSNQHSEKAKKSDQFNVDEEVQKESERLRPPEWHGARLVGVLLKEATIDSPGFRASTNFIDTQFKLVEKWIDSFLDSSSKLDESLNLVRDRVNGVIAQFLPKFAFTNILTEDYTSLAFGRYTQSMRTFWVTVLSEIQVHHNVLSKELNTLKADFLKEYKVARNDFVAAERKYDIAHSQYLAASLNKSEEELRDLAFAAWTSRKAHIEAAYTLCIAISKTEAMISINLIHALSQPFQLRRRSFIWLDQDRIDIGVDLHRLASLANHLKQTLPLLEEDLMKLKKSMLKQFAKMSPAPDVRPDSSYSFTNATISADTSSMPTSLPGDTASTKASKFGWVLVRQNASKSWAPLWAFVQNGVFGFLGLSPDKLYVQESDKYSVNTLRVRASSDHDRRFVFSVDMLSSGRLYIQARSAKDMLSWLAAFEYSKPEVSIPDDLFAPWSPEFALQLPGTLETNPSAVSLTPTRSGSRSHLRRSLSRNRGNAGDKSTTNVAHGLTPQVSQNELLSINHANSSEVLGNRSVSFTNFSLKDKIDHRLREMRDSYNAPDGIIHSSSLSCGDIASLTPAILANKPLPTSKSLESVVANWYLNPRGIPNAITSNFWGTVNWVTFGREHEVDETLRNDRSRSAGRQKSGHMEYPSYYSKTLVLQDGDMRSVLEELTDVDPTPEDLLMLVIRCTAKVGKSRHLPARLYITSRKLYIYGTWQGLVGLHGYDLDAILEVESRAGIDYDELNLVVLTHSTPMLIVLRLYIDNGLLAKRRLDFLIQNRRSKSSLPANEVQENLMVIGAEFAHAKVKYNDVASNNLPRAANTLKDDALHAETDNESISKPTTGPVNADEDNRWLKRFLWKQLKMPALLSSPRGEDTTLETEKGMDWKLMETTFTSSPRILFIAIFGDKSPVFKGKKLTILEFDSEVLPWYWQGNKLQRHIVNRLKKGQNSSTVLSLFSFNMKDSRTDIQTVTKSQDNFVYIVEEKHSPIQMPDKSLFTVSFKYVIYGTDAGSQMQIWGRISWHKSASSVVASRLVYEMSKIQARGTILNTRECLKRLTEGTTSEAIHEFGKVRASSKPPPREPRIEESVTQVRRSSLFALMFFKSFQVTFDICHFLIVDSFVWLRQLPMSRLIVLLTVVCSILLNILLLTRSSFAYWKAFFLDHREQQLIEDLGVFSANSLVSRRALHSVELEQAVADGTLFQSNPKSNDTKCASKFTELFQLADDWQYEPYYQLEPQAMHYMHTIEAIRTDAALKRVALASQMRMLNLEEQERLTKLYKEWVFKEVAMCGQARQRLYLLNASVFEGVQEYCVSCLQAASLDLL